MDLVTILSTDVLPYTDGHVWTGLQVIYRLYTAYIQFIYRQARCGHKACIINNKECSHGYLSGYLADPDKAMGCSTNTFFIHSLIQWWFVKISLRRRHALIELLDQKLRQFCWIGGFCLLVELHWEGSMRSLLCRFISFVEQLILLCSPFEIQLLDT